MSAWLTQEYAAGGRSRYAISVKIPCRWPEIVAVSKTLESVPRRGVEEGVRYIDISTGRACLLTLNLCNLPLPDHSAFGLESSSVAEERWFPLCQFLTRCAAIYNLEAGSSW